MVLKRIYVEIPDDIEKDFEQLINLFSLKYKAKSKVFGKFILIGIIKILEEDNSHKAREIKEKIKNIDIM